MKCYYEELGVSREATDAEIKTAYRKLALRWHPDKNPDCATEAKERFQLIQQAYDVLSDSQERAWYDNHREQILRGKNSEYEDNCLDVFQYFTVSCYKGYGDDAGGFYAVYSEVFKKIAAEDAEFMEEDDELEEIPEFGNSQSDYDKVVGPFYAYWSSYCTKKTYTWLCPYDVQEVRDRRILREIDKDMKKVVQKAKRERNEEVRNLVNFVRKRDKRVLAHRQLLEERAELNRQKQQQNRLEQLRKRQKELEEMRQQPQNKGLSEAYEEQLKQLEQQYGVSSSEEESDEEEEEEDPSANLCDDVNALKLEETGELMDDFYCVACNKSFKNARAYSNHELSKKHRENVEHLKREMQEEEDTFAASEEATAEATDDEVEQALEHDAAHDLGEMEDDIPTDTASEGRESATELPVTNKKSKKKCKKNKKANKLNAALLDSDEEQLKELKTAKNDVTADFLAQTKPAAVSSDEDWGQSNKKSSKKAKQKQIKQKDNDAKPVKEIPTVEPTKPSAARATTPDVIEKTTQHVCVTCHAPFESKNKLFAHLKKLNHGVYIPKNKTAADEEAPPKKSKGKRK